MGKIEEDGRFRVFSKRCRKAEADSNCFLLLKWDIESLKSAARLLTHTPGLFSREMRHRPLHPLLASQYVGVT